MSRQNRHRKERKEQELTQNSYHHVTGDNQHEQSAAYDVCTAPTDTQGHKRTTLHHCFQNKTLFHHKFKRETFFNAWRSPKKLNWSKNVLSQDCFSASELDVEKCSITLTCSAVTRVPSGMRVQTSDKKHHNNPHHSSPSVSSFHIEIHRTVLDRLYLLTSFRDSDHLFIYIYAFSRRFYSKRLSGYIWFFVSMCSLGIETHNLLRWQCNALPLSHRNHILHIHLHCSWISH